MLRIITYFCLLTLSLLLFPDMANAGPGDTTVVRTFRYDTTMRSGIFNFPNDPDKTYEKIIMLYSMRCKNGLISTQTLPNQGCGEWDYNCFTYVVDSSQNDSLIRKGNAYNISNFSGSTFPYTSQPVYTYYQFVQPSVSYSNVTSEVISTLGSDSLSLNHPLGGGKLSRTQYIWTAGELISAGLAAGEINGLGMDLGTIGPEILNLSIRIKPTTLSILNTDSPELNGFTEVYFHNTLMATAGFLRFNFSVPFVWDGISNILVDISYSNGNIPAGATVKGQDAGFPAAITTTDPQGYLRLKGGIQALQMNPGWYSSVNQEVSLGFWCKGDTVLLPSNSTILEGTDNSNNRQINIHLPWSNSNIYWDCGGNSSGFDRIYKAAATAEIKGKWNFWSFTKNATTGRMKVYLNGELWLQDSNKTRPINIQKMVVGNSLSGGNPWAGYLSEFSLWNKELSQAEIQEIMYHSITPAHPSYSNLMVYYPLDETSGSIAHDAAQNAYHANLLNPAFGSLKGKELLRNFVSSNIRPNTSFIQGTYTYVYAYDTLLDSVLNIPNSVISNTVVNNNLLTVDTTYVYAAGMSYVYDADGLLIDSVAIAAETTLTQNILTYYLRRPMRVELINFITPYGKGLSLNGLVGKTWAFDVTDYASVLKGPRYMAMSDGIYQEDNDITFVYYEGTPTRNVVSLQQIWPSGSWVSPSWFDIYNNNYFEPRQFTLSPDAAQYKIRSSISGHGQEGEFISRNHSIKINDSIAFTRAVWTECATNPIYPQGGTWIYDRAGWCPGAAVDRVEYAVPASLVPGSSMTLDYSMPFIANPGSSNYRINNQIVSYGPPNFGVDAGVAYIKQPSDRVEFQRLNPFCTNPVIAIKNNGSTTLTSLDIVYGRKGGAMSTFQWTGNLPFMGVAEVTVPAPDYLSSLSNQFVARLSNPNGSTDEYSLNDTLYSAFTLPPVYPSDVIFELRTNHAGYQNQLNLKDSQGNVVFSKTGLANDFTYRDTLHLIDDCYTLSLSDAGDNGLYFWNEPGQGSGYLRMLNLDGIAIKTFNPDFGDNIYHQFTIGLVLPVEEINAAVIKKFSVYPNPATDNFVVEFSLPIHALAHLSVVNLLGQTLMQQDVKVSQETEVFPMNASGLKEGFYFVVLETTEQKQTKKLVIKH